LILPRLIAIGHGLVSALFMLRVSRLLVLLEFLRGIEGLMADATGFLIVRILRHDRLLIFVI
jgi:hypothetical protein